MDTSSDTLDRAITDRIIDDQEPVTFFGTGEELHGGTDCAQWAEPITMGILQAVIQPPPRWCDCRGFHATRAGRLLALTETLYSAIDQDRAGAHETTWRDVHQRLRHNETHLAANATDVAGRNDTNRAALDELIRRSAHASETIAQRSRRHLDVGALHRAFAAQTIRMPITAAEAPVFARWAREQRINEIRSRNLTDGTYDRTLEHAIRSSPTVTTVTVYPRAADSSPIGATGLPAEIELLIWWHRQSANRYAIIDVPEIVAHGMSALVANRRRGRIGICRDLDIPRETLEEAIVLWTDPGSSYGELDDAISAVLNL